MVAGVEIFLSVVVIYFASNSTGYQLPNRNHNKIDRLLTGYHNKTTGYQLMVAGVEIFLNIVVICLKLHRLPAT